VFRLFLILIKKVKFTDHTNPPMKKNRLIFYSIFGALHLFIFIFSIYMDSKKNDVSFLFGLQGKIWMLKYCSFILLILMIVNVVLHFRDNIRNRKEKDQLAQELNTLKARLYDIQEGKAKSNQPN
jgi:hypothetical protein